MTPPSSGRPDRPPRFRAPGKIVVSGAYSVLWGAPSIVAATTRGAIADAAREATHVADEVRAAIELGFIERACAVDVSALRAPTPDGGSRKLGLGSSAAIVVSTLAALTAAVDESPTALRARVFDLAMRAHKRVQPDGSGIDVAASTFGGVLVCRVASTPSGEHALDARPTELRADIRVVASQHPASTKDMVARVRAYAAASPSAFQTILDRAASAAADASSARDAEAFIAALRAQDDALRALARDSGAPIFTPEFDALARIAERDGAFFGPSGAGGGDVGIHVARATGDPGARRDASSGSPAWSEAFATGLAELGVDAIDLGLGAPGVARAEETGAALADQAEGRS